MFNFPQADHVSLPRPPLNEVVCQVKFPPILQIGEKQPAEFQDQVRAQFPLFEVPPHIEFKLELGGESDNPALTAETSSVYRFITMDHASMISLNLQFCSFSTTHYEGWKSFSAGLRTMFDVVGSIYHPAGALRIGLRYVNFLNPETTGITDMQTIMKLVRPELAAPFSIDAFPVAEGLGRVVSEDGDRRLSLIFGFVKDESDERSFVLDLDLFTEIPQPFELESVMHSCNEFHSVLYNAFRWCLVEGSLEKFSSSQTGS